MALAALLAALSGCTALTPGAAEPAADALAIVVPPLHVGDALAYRLVEHESSDGGETLRGESTATLLVEGHARAFDRFGIERETLAIRGDWDNEDIDTSYTCHVLAGGIENVRWDAHAAYSYRQGPVLPTGTPLPGQRVFQGNTFYGGSCDLLLHVAGRTLRAGDRLGPEVLEDVAYWGPVRAGSLGAEPVEHEGRRGLRFTWAWDLDGERARIDAVFVEGIPSYAHLAWRMSGPGWTWGGDWRLTGFAPGSGEPTPDEGARLPATHPQGEFRPFDPLALDDAAFGLRFPYPDAVAAVLRDPTQPLDEWLAAHPDAVLSSASYWRTPRGVGSERASDGGWIFQFVSSDAFITIGTERFALDASGVPLPDALKPVRNEFVQGPRPPDLPYPRTEVREVASSEHLARMAEPLVPRDDVWRLVYFLFPDGEVGARPYLTVDNANASLGSVGYGKMVALDMMTGGLASTWNATRSGSIDLLAPPAAIAARAAPAAPQPGIGWREGVAAPAAALALLVLAKLALALYTRLARDRLLENPVRARLYERVRAEPGIHREELIDFAGIGNGATRHHLRKLVAHGFVLEMAEGGFARYYAAGEVTPDAARQHALLRVGRAREVYDLYAAEPDVPLREAARRLGMSAPSVHRVRRRLAAAGLLRR